MDMEITPQVGVGRLVLGMSREDARRAVPGLRDNSRSVCKVQLVEDVSEEDGVELHYGENEDGDTLSVMTICLFFPADPRLFGRQLLGMTYNEASAWLEKIDPEAYEEDESIFSPAHGVECCAEDLPEDPDALINSVYLWDPNDA